MGLSPATAVTGVAFGNDARIGGDIHIGSQTFYFGSTESAAPANSSIPHQAPPLPTHHVSRRGALEALIGRLHGHCPSAQGTLPIIALHGLGGIGKSTLAAELAHCPEALALFPDGVLWATLGPQPQIETSLTSWVRGVGERATEVWSDTSATAFLRTVLRERRVLLVVDDVWQESHIRPFLVGGSQCCLVMTTRRAGIVDRLGATPVPVNELEPDESVRLMARRAGKGNALAYAEEQEARLLTQLLGHLPLAVELVAALVARRYSWTEARLQLIDFENALSPEAKNQSDAQRKLEACLGLSFSVLRSESIELWQAYAWLGLIPYEQRINASMAATLWNVDPVCAQRWLHALEDDALLRRTPEGYALHSLLHQMALQLLRKRAPDGLGLTLRQGHQELVKRYVATAKTGHLADIRDDGYIIDRWTWHLVEAGLSEAVFDLLGANDADGNNRWYQRRNQTGRLAGYLDDLNLARQVALETRNRWQQVLVALCRSSVLSVTANYTDDVVSSLVRRGLWSPLWAFRWAQHVCAPHQRIDCLLAVTSAAQIASPTGKEPEFLEVARQALTLAQSLVAERPPTEASFRLMLRTLASAAAPDKAEALSSALAWCRSPELKAELLLKLPSSVAQASQAVATQLNLTTDPLERVLLLAALVRCLPADERGIAGDRLINELAVALPVCTNSLPPRVAKTRGKTFSKRSTPLEDPAKGAAARDSIDILCEALGTVLPSLPTSLKDRAAAQLRGHHAYPPVQRLLETLSRLRNLLRRESEFDEASRFATLNSETKRKVAAELLVNRGDPSLVLSIVQDVDKGAWEADDLLVWLGALPATVQTSVLHKIARKLGQLNPQALCPRLILAPDTVAAQEIVGWIHKAGATTARKVVTACLLYASDDIATSSLTAFSRIHDHEERARAMLAILPFLPPDANRSHFEDLLNAQIAGPQIAGMTAMMVDLSRAIDANALAEVVEATSKNQSEWWVVEALMVALLRVQELPELRAIIGAASSIRNLDLRARLLDRVATRLADLRIDVLAIDVARSIELPAMRWDALQGLAVRFASTGNLSAAKQAAISIEPHAPAQKTFVDIAMELGALGMTNDARQLVTEYVVDIEWKTYAALIYDSAASDKRLTADRQYSRAKGEQRMSRFEMISISGQDIGKLLGAGSPVEPMIEASKRANEAMLEKAVFDAWSAPGANGKLLCDMLSGLQRPSALLALAQIAPTLDIGADPGDVVRIVEAIRHVSRWWP